MVETGRMPEIASSDRKLDKNACSTQKMMAPMMGPKMVAAPPKSNEVQMKKVSEVTKIPGETFENAA